MASRARTLLLVLVIGGVLSTSCGGSGKPAYCSSVDNLTSSIKALPSTNVVQSGLKGLESAFGKVQSNAQSVINDAKHDFPNETNALKSSLDALSSTVNQLTSSPSAAAIAQVPSQVSALVSSVDDFATATKSKCS